MISVHTLLWGHRFCEFLSRAKTALSNDSGQGPHKPLCSFGELHHRQTAAAWANACTAFMNSVMHQIAGIDLSLHCSLDSPHTAPVRQPSLQQACETR